MEYTRAYMGLHIKYENHKNGSTAVSTNDFKSENPVILNLKDLLDNPVYGD
jgi:hypothetical protein